MTIVVIKKKKKKKKNEFPMSTGIIYIIAKTRKTWTKTKRNAMRQCP